MCGSSGLIVPSANGGTVASEIVWYWGGDRHLIQKNSIEGKAAIDCMGQTPSLEETLGRA